MDIKAAITIAKLHEPFIQSPSWRAATKNGNHTLS